MEGNEENNYQKFIALINSIKETKPVVNIEVINISKIFNVEGLQYGNYNDIIPQLEKVEKHKYVARPQPKEALQQKREEIQPHIISAGLQQAQYAQTAQVKVIPQPKPSVNAKKEFGHILNKFTSFTEHMNENKQQRKIVKVKINIKDLVLPSLSISDQISELERIIEGLNEHVFDNEHIEIVAEEVYGLQQYINIGKKAKGKKQQVPELERSLEELRDQRLTDAVSLLSKYNASAGGS